ncbi:hypothetical protein D3C78_1014490 [compost metagenome]
MRTGDLVASHHPRLDHRVAFPIAALVLVILLQGIEAEHQGAGRTVRAQAHVDTEHKTVDGDRVQGLDQALAQAGEELLVIQRALDPFSLAAFREGEDQVDVRRQVQFHRAELAHAQHHHVLRLAAAVADRRAELLAMARVQPVVGLVDRSVGKVGQVAAGLHQVGLAGQVAPDDPHLLAAALAAQVARQFVFALGSLGGGSDLRAQRTRGKCPVELATGGQIDQHRRVAQHLFKDEITGRSHPGKLRPALGVPAFNRQFGELGDSRTKRLLVTADQGSEGGRQFGQQRQAHGLSLIGEKRLASGSGLAPRLGFFRKIASRGKPAPTDHCWTVVQKLEIAVKTDFLAETIAANLFLTCF